MATLSAFGTLWADNRACSCCELRKQCRGPVPAQLVAGADLMFVAEAPGGSEDIDGVPLVGKAGKFFDHLLSTIELRRADISVSNVCKCRPSSTNAQPKPEHVALCAPLWLEQELALQQPKVVVAMGAVSAHYLLGEKFRSLPMEEIHGLPFYPDETGRPFIVFATYHPAAGFHDSTKMGAVYDDFRDLRLLLDGQLVRPRDEYQAPVYQEILPSLRDPTDYAQGKAPPIGLDFETTADGALYCWSLCEKPGTGEVIFHLDDPAGSTALLRAICENPDQTKVFHNLIGVDYQVIVEELGIKLVNYVDTMIGAYNLSFSPQGLKPLVRRRLGMEMEDYGELIVRAQRRWLLQRLEQVAASSCDLLPPPPGTRQKKAWSLQKKAAELLVKAENPDYKLLAAYERLAKKTGGVMEKLVGPEPAWDLRLLPRDEVVRYSARDPDATLRLWGLEEPLLHRMGMRK